MTIPYRLANGPGNLPDADKFMADYDWLTALIYGSFVLNGGQENWSSGTSFTNPANGTVVSDSWVYRTSGGTPSSCDISRDSGNINSGTYSLKMNITGAGSADSLVAIDQPISSYSRFASLTVLFGARIKVSTASKVRLKIYDGVTTSYSPYHTGDGTFQLLQVALACSASLTQLTVSIEVTSDFTGAIYSDSISLFMIPATMTTAAKALLEYSLNDSPEGGDVVFGTGKGPIVFDQDGSGRKWRIGVSGGVLGADPV